MKQTAGKIGFLFHPGHGHYTQFLNFQECLPSEYAHRAKWAELHGDSSGDWLCKIPFLPGALRYRRHQLWHARKAIAQEQEWDALFFAAQQLSFRPFVRRHRSYLYTDLTPSLKRELAPWYDHQLNANPIIASFRTRMWKSIIASYRGIFTMSEWAKKGIQLDYGIPADRIHVVLPGANLKRWPYIDRRNRSMDKPVRILMVGGQFKLKGGELLLEWAEQTHIQNWEIDIVTWPGELPAWVRACLNNPGSNDRISRSLEPRLPQVRIHCGMKANTLEIMSLYEKADIFCLPTQADGSSIASLEAMASGLPVLVGAVGGIPELINDGETGFLLKRGNGEDLKIKLETFLTDATLRQHIGYAARKSCENHFNVSRQVQDILKIIDSGS